MKSDQPSWETLSIVAFLMVTPLSKHCRKLVETIPISIFVYIKTFLILTRLNLMQEERKTICSIFDEN